MNYSSILNTLVYVRDLSNDTDATLQQILYQQRNFLSGNMLLQRTSIVNNSNQLLFSSQSQSSEIGALFSTIDSAVMQEIYTLNKVAIWNNNIIQLTSDVMVHRGATNSVLSEINETIVRVTDELNTIQETSLEVATTSSSLLSSTLQILESINATNSVSITKFSIILIHNNMSRSQGLLKCYWMQQTLPPFLYLMTLATRCWLYLILMKLQT